MSHSVQNTLTGLKKLLDDKGQLKVSYEGQVYTVVCTFNSPTNLNEVDIFEKENNIKLPEDYKAFLSLHNGARIFQLTDEKGEKIGGGLTIYTFDEIRKLQEIEMFNELGIPIANLLEDCYLYLDIDKIKAGDPNYLNILEFIDLSPLNLSFEAFLERYIKSRGNQFW
ncbi:SMI1/KNR4 family protein [Bacillus sp. OVS6]|uniref:SMI1/KNR4 family protein n=1 Tax=Metabacillus dongyingensis TaxID=2874282 RepID=UPI001CBB2C68|nr:SMI1/KNR4 family protein [Metabacillus dongyingensis]UAL53825.1 SMI1/KNR4 family protein [Metabacillus dongyingensis]UOK59239.1 SMI1/KNR4 family protein [Bacillus sp. OVS6]